MRLLACVAAATLLGLFAHDGRAADGNIRLFFDPHSCRGEIPCGETRNLYVYAELEGATANGITGLEYGMQIGMDGAPDHGWVSWRNSRRGSRSVWVRVPSARRTSM